jgi:hypothetical protein
MIEIALTFEGICTHLIPTHRVDKAPRFKLWTDTDIPIQHRVVLPSSDFIETHIEEDRQFDPHDPELRIDPKEMNADLEELFDQDGVWKARNVAVGFEGVDDDAGDPSHFESLRALPHIWELAGGRGVLREHIKRGWSRFAATYIDFTGGVRFRTEKPDKMVLAFGTLFFHEAPVLVVRERNAGKGMRYSLAGVSKLWISNQGRLEQRCTENDYLLNYFSTDLDLLKDPPTWPCSSDPDRIDVYCSSSNYP